jgi:hypothetical protein
MEETQPPAVPDEKGQERQIQYENGEWSRDEYPSTPSAVDWKIKFEEWLTNNMWINKEKSNHIIEYVSRYLSPAAPLNDAKEELMTNLTPPKPSNHE